MPNWCENRVEISLDESVDGKAFLLNYGEIHHKGGNDYLWKLDYNNLIPTPDEVLKTLDDDTNSKSNKYQTPGSKRPYWYNWRNYYWGVKWNAVSAETDDKSNWIQVKYNKEWNNSISFSYETPWKPPGGIAKAFWELEEVDDVVWFYDEPGMGFAGYLH